jgi:hypothetical protein
MSTSYTSQLQWLVKQNRDRFRETRTLTGIVKEQNLQTQQRLYVQALTKKAIANLTQLGFEPFLLSFGAPPDSSPDLWGEILVDRYRWFYLYDNGGGSQRIFQWDIGLYCTTERMITYPQTSMDWQDFLEMLGPSGCAGSTECLCYIEMTKQHCLFNQTGGLGVRKVVGKISTLTAAGTDICLSAVDTSDSRFAPYYRIIDNAADLKAAMTNRCTEQTGSVETVIVSLGSTKWVASNYSSVPAACSIDFATVTDLTVSYPGPEFAFFTLIPISYQYQYPKFQQTYQKLTGTMPDGVTVETNPFATCQGQPGVKHTVHFISFDQNVVPIKRLYAPRISAGVNINIDGVSRSENDVQIGFNGLGFEPYYMVFGDPTGSTAYDVPIWLADASPAASARRGPSYALFRNASCMTQACWVAANGVAFDARLVSSRESARLNIWVQSQSRH